MENSEWASQLLATASRINPASFFKMRKGQKGSRESGHRAWRKNDFRGSAKMILNFVRGQMGEKLLLTLQTPLPDIHSD